MSLKAKIEAVIYASEEPVTLPQLVGLLGVEGQAELDALDARQGSLLPLGSPAPDEVEDEANDPEALNAETLAGSADADAAELAAEFTGAQDGLPQARAADGDAPTLTTSGRRDARERERRLREHFRGILDRLIAEYAHQDRGLEIREVAGGFRFSTKPEFHDTVRGFVRSLKPPLKLSLQALETLAVVAYKQPVTAPEISEVRGVDSGGVLGSLMARKLITTAGRKQVIGRPILYKTTKEFLLRFGLKDTSELPSIEEFEKMAGELTEAVQEEIPMSEGVPARSGANPSSAWAEPLRDVHDAQADGVPEGTDIDPETDADPDAPGEFSGNVNVEPADNVEVDGRLSGVPPTYDTPGDQATESPAHDAEVQSGQE